jgi:hypothetical protein
LLVFNIIAFNGINKASNGINDVTLLKFFECRIIFIIKYNNMKS